MPGAIAEEGRKWCCKEGIQIRGEKEEEVDQSPKPPEGRKKEEVEKT